MKWVIVSLLLISQAYAANYVTFTGDPLWVGDEILTSDGTPVTNATGICWSWYNNEAISEAPDWEDGACDATTDANGRLGQITVTTAIATDGVGLLRWCLAGSVDCRSADATWAAAYLTVQED